MKHLFVVVVTLSALACGGPTDAGASGGGSAGGSVRAGGSSGAGGGSSGAGGGSSSSFGSSNVAVCKDLVAKLRCGTAVAPLTASTCDGYAATTCDFSSYFRCIDSAYVCTNGMYDTTKLVMASSCTAPTCR